jgi:hypothetical protein
MTTPMSKPKRSRALPQVVSFVTAFCIVFAASVSGGQPDSSKEYQIKAAFLLNFIQFIEWPAAAFPNSETPITVGVLGDDPFGDALEQTFREETVRGRKLIIKRSRQVEELKACHLLFISKSEKDHFVDILTKTQDASIVTVAEMEDFARRGGIINFYMSEKKVRFEINVAAAERKDLKVSSQLLKRAKIVS